MKTVDSLLKMEGRQAMLERFGNDLDKIRHYIRIECRLAPNKDLSRIMKEFKILITLKNKSKKQYPEFIILILEIINKVKEAEMEIK